ncbi:hypothetical protein CIG75_00515 [Tumebacillus algifaecis]|uniref:Uncharacterized protein n=1 Tax=Tumebacillus algifaecis TaxID=1214604 RepID=A0A223CWA8_9BACL|nr:hypothetical protein [Tumebacillus algifaecis]ASS73606.1 hypothetical protein CIG75_00515 [Tumebacillus algifaecis]
MSRFENSDWQVGMPLPSRKDKHGRKKGKAKKQDDRAALEQRAANAVVPKPPKSEVPAPVLEQEAPRQAVDPFVHDQAATLRAHCAAQDAREAAPNTHSEDQAVQLREMSSARTQEEMLFTQQHAAELREILKTRKQAVAATVAQHELEWNEEVQQAHETQDADTVQVEEETEPVIGKWTYRLLMIFVPLVLIGVLAYGKLGYVHQVPELVRDNVSAYEQGEGFLVLKPWWFGPPVYKLDEYVGSAGSDFYRYQLNLRDFAKIVEEPIVLWRFQKDFLQK